jgi:membrane-bound inhibitor of C-type lysozyme
VVANTVIRFESQLETADAATIARFLQVGRNFTADQIPDLHGPAPTPNPMTTFAPGPPPVAPGISAAGVVAGGLFGELQVAAFDTVNVIVYGTPNGPFFSTNGGQTAQTSTFNTVAAPPAAAFVSLGDPTVAIGAPNASFAQTAYYAQLQQVAAAAGGANKPTVAIGLYQSANGSTFNNLGFPRNCSVAAQGCVVPDQEQLASDRINRAVTATGSFDQLYLAWRNFTSPTTNSMTVAVACSQDNGANWTVDLTTLAKSGADFPRLAVGPDGTLLVAYSVISGSGATYSLRTQKWGSCASGFRPGDSATVGKSAVTEVTDMPGLDRPPKGNYAPAWENTFRVFVVYANEASAGNDDIHVAESVDAGKTWDRDSIVSKNGTGRRYFPWVCSTVGKNFVSWYDRRGSTAANPDLTAYFRSSVFDNGSTSTVGVGPEVNVSGVNDAQCAPGFPNQVRGATEITACTGLPGGFIQGGTCQFTCAPGVAGPCGSGRACDFRAANPCPALPPPAPAESCTAGNLGQPKYGDYNGAACALGTLFVAWTSATPASGAACLVNGLPATSASQCCSGVLSGGTCAATAAACVANGGACGPATTCCSATAGGRCQAGQCMPAITMYTGSSCLGPGCAGAPVKITYHQTGACNGFVIPTGAVSAGPNAAYVIFGIERIDNSLGTTTFNFDPDRIFVQQTGPRKFDSSLQLYPNVLGPFAVTTQTFAPGANSGFAVSAQGATVVTTTNADGAVEANQTAYFLQYDRQPSDPQITFVKSDAARTSWPLTRDCKTIVLK